jgi:uncharacterized protein
MAIRFEWDPKKAAANRAKHGVTFEMACETFQDMLSIVEIDEREDYGEERLIRLGMSVDRLLFVSYTERLDERSGDEIIRIVSAPRATRHERRKYQEG